MQTPDYHVAHQIAFAVTVSTPLAVALFLIYRRLTRPYDWRRRHSDRADYR